LAQNDAFTIEAGEQLDIDELNSDSDGQTMMVVFAKAGSVAVAEVQEVGRLSKGLCYLFLLM
jgi:hypothetical protein